MAIFETFSKRKKKQEQTGIPTVFQYSDLPETFRVQVAHIWNTSLGEFEDYYDRSDGISSSHLWQMVHETIARELGVFELGQRTGDLKRDCIDHLLTADAEDALDIIEVAFRVIEYGAQAIHPYRREAQGIRQEAEDAIGELNHRFREHGIGYQIVSGELIQVDSLYIHSEVVEPAISLLHDAQFRGASEEFLHAHEHYRKGRHKEAIAEALKAFESTMKAICDAHGWTYPANATANPLIDIVIKNGLVSEDMESHFKGLQAAMKSGLPTLSNKTSRHGQGTVPKAIPEHFAAYALHLAASNIVFLVEAHKALRRN